MFHENHQVRAAAAQRRSRQKASTLEENSPPSRRPGRWGLAWLAAFLCAFSFTHIEAFELSRAEARQIGQRVWQNECGGTIAGLTSWNAGENFASLGIGHFIWYPRGMRGPFEESFPHYANFAASHGAKLPPVVLAHRESGCLWNSRAEFIAASDSPSMKELRKFLAETIDLQADFLVQRLKQALPKLLANAATDDRANIQRQFERVATAPRGGYALVDYVNFKGEGLLDTERYHGQGWGLFQVLQGMNGNDNGPTATQEFAASASRVLKRRVQNSPTERKEARWLAGWLQRVNTYAH